MNNDRELLELAAKAAGINPLSVACGPGTWWDSESRTTYTCWNPLASDGDRYQLARALKFVIDFEGEEVRFYIDGDVIPRRFGFSTNGGEAYAIVHAAAEIGRAMK